ncbi:hypothetical protein ACSQ67_011572 [Phaseolus vulgaris]
MVAIENILLLFFCLLPNTINVTNALSSKHRFDEVDQKWLAVKLRVHRGKVCVTVCDEERLIGKLLEEGKERFTGLFGSIVPWDDSFTINERYFALREEGVGRRVGIGVVAGSKDVGGRERLPSVGSSFDEEYGRRKGEEMTVRCKVAQVEPILGVAQQKRSFNSVINATLGVWEGILDGKLLEKQGEVSFASCGKTSSDSSKVVEGVIKCRGVKNAACINGVKEVIENVQEENGRARHEMIGGRVTVRA